MNHRLNLNPEIGFRWEGNRLSVEHPKKINRPIKFCLEQRRVEVCYDGKGKVFNINYLSGFNEQFEKIYNYCLGELLEKDALSMSKPKMKENQIAVMRVNQKYGQVLTINNNLFLGWGETYLIFENINEASKFCETNRKNELEFYLFDSQYEFIKSIY
jgi:hypothetical protein